MKRRIRWPTSVHMRHLLIVDTISIVFAVVVSFVIRYEALVNVGPYLRRNWTLFLLAPAVRLPTYSALGLYRRLWRYLSIKEAQLMVFAGIAATAVVSGINFGLFPLVGIPYCPSRSVILLEGGISTAALAGTRLLLRLVSERFRGRGAAKTKEEARNERKVLIAGAGDAGAMILREMEQNPGLGLQAIGLVDDDPAKLNMRVHGLRVLGTREEIPDLVKRHDVDEVIIAMPTAPGSAIRAIKRICDEVDVRSRALPGMYELIGGRAIVRQLRELRIEDLLRREPVDADKSRVVQLIPGKRVLVTGAGGSIGSELCRQIARLGPSHLVLLGHGENSLFGISNELRRRFPALRASTIVADTRDRSRMETVFQRLHPQIVFHAAAHKHVPLMEANIEDAVTNNIVGTLNLVRVAQDTGCSHLVLISTDKAVNPTSVMGATKHVAEMIVRDAARQSGRCFVVVRFGNVLGSRGSVVPTFQDQIERGGPVTVTHPDVERYFMTIPEAVELVLQAAALGDGGEVFVLDMGEPVKIVDLARDLIGLSGFQVGKDIEIEYTGLRPGEKLFEELFAADEQVERTSHERILVCRNSACYPQGIDGSKALSQTLSILSETAQRGDTDMCSTLLRELVPCYEIPQVEAGA